MVNPILAILAVPTIMAITAGSVVLISKVGGESAKKQIDDLHNTETEKTSFGSLHDAKESVKKSINGLFSGDNEASRDMNINGEQIDDLISEGKEYIIIESARVLKQHGKSDEEVKKLLSEKFSMSEDEVDKILKKGE